MAGVRSLRRLSSISARSTSGLPRPAPPNPPFVAITTPSGGGERATPIVSSLWPPVYRWAVSIICTPAATAALMRATFSRVWVRRLVPRPMRRSMRMPATSIPEHHARIVYSAEAEAVESAATAGCLRLRRQRRDDGGLRLGVGDTVVTPPGSGRLLDGDVPGSRFRISPEVVPEDEVRPLPVAVSRADVDVYVPRPTAERTEVPVVPVAAS